MSIPTVFAAMANVLAEPPQVDPYALTSGRLWAVTAALLGLAGLVAGGVALARTGAGRTGAVVAIAAGLAGTVIGAGVLATAEGGAGTGYGTVGGYVALAVGVIAVVTGVLARARSARRPVAK